VLEGSVRKVGTRLRINAQLIDGGTNQHVWVERYDRELSDIFALQDEISEAIVNALRLRLLPEEKLAIGQRGTNSIDAYNLYLMALQLYRDSKVATPRGSDAIVRLCGEAVKIDPNYGRAWAMIALARAIRVGLGGGSTEEALAAAERAIEIDRSIAEAHTAKGTALISRGDRQEGWQELETALQLDPDSAETNVLAGIISESERRYEAAIGYFERAARVSKAGSPVARLTRCYLSIGDLKRARANAELTLERIQASVAQEPENGIAIGYRVLALAVLGRREHLSELVSSGLLLVPDNEMMKAYFLRAYSHLKDVEHALAMLGSLLERTGSLWFARSLTSDIDLDFLRDDPRFKAMVDATEARLGRSPSGA